MLLKKKRLLRKWRYTYFGRKQYNSHVMYTLFLQSASFILPSVAFYAYQLAKCQSKAVGTWYVHLATLMYMTWHWLFLSSRSVQHSTVFSTQTPVTQKCLHGTEHCASHWKVDRKINQRVLVSVNSHCFWHSTICETLQTFAPWFLIRKALLTMCPGIIMNRYVLLFHT